MKRKVKKEPIVEPQFVVGQTVGTLDQPMDLKSAAKSQEAQE